MIEKILKKKIKEIYLKNDNDNIFFEKIFKKNSKHYRFKIFNYLRYLLKISNQNKVTNKFEKKILIILHILIHEMSADLCCSLYGIKIYNFGNVINLKKIKKCLEGNVPSGFKISFLNNLKPIGSLNKIKNNKKYVNICINNELIKKFSSEKFDYLFNLDINKKKINAISNYKNRSLNLKYPTFIKEYPDYEIKKKKFINKNIKNIRSISGNYKNIKLLNVKKKQSYSVNYNFINKKNERVEIYNKNFSFKIRPIETYKIKNVCLNFYGTLSINNEIISESIVHRDTGLVENNKILCPDKVDRIINHKCIVIPVGTNTISHYIFEGLLKLSINTDLKNYKIVVFENIADYLIEIILSLGVKKKNILKKPFFEKWHIKEVLFKNLNWFEVNFEDISILNSKIKQKVLIPNKFKNYNKVYISRKDSRENRNLINEDELENELEKSGYKIVLFSKLSLKEKINLFNETRKIVTPLGSAIHNIYFNKNHKKKIEVTLIGFKNYFFKDYKQISLINNIKLNFIPCKSILSYSKFWDYNHSSFFIDMDHIKNMIKKNLL